jgi:enoyl-CoA hydratase
MEYTRIEVAIENGICTATFTRPDKLNALDRRTLEELDQLADTLLSSNDVSVLILKGSGKAFVAGADILAMVDMNSQQANEFSTYGQSVFLKIENLPIPVIASINGFCLGGGCELAMACDIRISSNKGKFGQPEVNLGVTPGFGGTQRLSKLTGIGNAIDLLTTGRIIRADEAKSMGLVERVVEHDELDNEVRSLAELIASKCIRAVKANKLTALKGVITPDYPAEAKAFADCFSRGDAKTGMQAFIDKKDPDWR